MKKLLLLIALLSAQISYAQVSFQKNYGAANTNEYGQSVIQAADSGYYVAGSKVHTNPIIGEGLLMRTDKQGNEVWTKTYVTNSSLDIGFDNVIHTSDGKLMMVGVAVYTLPQNYDVCLVKVDTAGNQLWMQRYGGDYRQRGMQVKETFDHGFIIGGWNEMFGTATSNFYLIRTDSIGDTLWTRNYPTGHQQYGYAVDQMPDSGFVIAGSIDVATFGTSTYVIRTDKSGDTLWTKILSSIDYSAAYDVRANADGHIMISGYSNMSGCSQPLLAELDGNGDLLWHEQYTDGPCGWSYSVAKTNDGGYAVFGMDNTSNFYLIKTDVNGQQDWYQKFDEMPGEFGYSMKQTSDNGYIMAGIGNDNGNINIVLVKTGSDGTVLSNQLISDIKQDISIYPNPASSVVYIQHNGDIRAIELYDITGKLISSYGEVDRIDVSGLAKGVYYVQCSTGEGVVTEKVIVE